MLRVYILLKNCPERQKIARGCYNRKKLLQTPKVAKHNPNRPIRTYITGMCLHGTQVILLQIVVVSPGTHLCPSLEPMSPSSKGNGSSLENQMKMLGLLCNQTVNLKTDSKTLYDSILKSKYSSSILKHNKG